MTIKQGDNYATPGNYLSRFLWKPTEMRFTFTVPELPHTEGIQKVDGFSRGDVHKNSIRLGIRKENDYNVMYCYAYVNGEKKIGRIGWLGARTGKDVDVFLWFDRWSVGAKIWIDGVDLLHDVAHFKKKDLWLNPIGYKLQSYFEHDGYGQFGAPYEIDFKVRDVKIT